MGTYRVIQYTNTKRKCWEAIMKSIWMAAVAMSGLLAPGPASAQGAKIGILNDQSAV